MSKLEEDFRTAFLGAFGGLFTCAAYLLVERIAARFTYLSCVDRLGYAECDRGPAELVWVPIAFWHVLLFVAASFIVHRHLDRLGRSTFMLWQLIGLYAFAGWALSFLALVSLECLVMGNLYALGRAVNETPWLKVVQFVCTVLAGNVAYATVLQSAARRYGVAPEDSAAEA